MSERTKFIMLLILLVLSIGLLLYVKTHIGQDFIRQFQ
jgi:hypothetical protein